jgi:SulP family sulfate permease
LSIIDNYKQLNIKNDILSGSVVAMALVPEAIAFSFIAGVNPLVGLYTAFILGLITAIIGGKAGMISGATGAVAIVMVALVAEYGLDYLLWATILTGLIQITIGLFKLGKFIRLVPQPVMFGFVNGLAIVIASAQLNYFAGEGMLMYIIVLATMGIMYFLPKFTKAVPSSLVAIILLSSIVILFDLDTKRVGDLADISGAFPSFSIPNAPLNLETLKIILPYSIIMALVGLIESLLTLSVLDELGGERGSGNQECIAQGVGNVTCGFAGAMAGCAMIGQSIINFTSGGLGRLSGITASILLILFVVSLSGLIVGIPIAVLVGIMFMVSIATFEWGSIRRLKYMPRVDVFVLVLTTIITVVADLAIAVITGVIISALAFAWKQAKITVKSKKIDEDTKIYFIEGPLFFGSATTFNDNFDFENDPKKVIFDFKNARVVDASGVDAIDNITKKYSDNNTNLVLRYLSADCKKMLKEAGPYCTYEEDEPTYKVAVNY